MAGSSSSSLQRLCAVRGATTLGGDDVETYRVELLRLMKALVEQNHIAPDDMVTVFFTVTRDLTSTNPAKVVREGLGWTTVPMLCSVEPEVVGMPPFCIRVLIQFYSQQQPFACRPVYLNGAAALRPDLA